MLRNSKWPGPRGLGFRRGCTVQGMDLGLGLSGLSLFMAKGSGLGFMALDVLGFSQQGLEF